MILVDKEEYIEISFVKRSYEDRNYVEICLSFSMEDVGWGVTEGYFSLSSIKAISDNLDQMIKGIVKECHVVDPLSEAITPFYWLDVTRRDDGYDVHLKIHDCLEDYIEITEIVDESKLKSFQIECQKAYEEYSRPIETMD